MAVTKELLQMDLYALLGIEEKAEDKEVKKAYRQKALSCHPDKNPDNPRAAELFHQLSQALEVLTDAAARAAYDKVRKARKQAAERTQKLDERRKKVKLDLEARERQAQALGSEEEEESGSTRTLEQEIERLREEGSRQLEEQQRLIREQIRQEQEQRLRGMAENPENKETPKLKLKWKSRKEAESQGGYSRDVLLRLFQKELAVQNEVGLVDNPLKISWLEGRPQSAMGHNHPGLSRVRSRASLFWAYSSCGVSLPIWALLRALSSQNRHQDHREIGRSAHPSRRNVIPCCLLPGWLTLPTTLRPYFLCSGLPWELSSSSKGVALACGLFGCCVKHLVLR
uniref:DnaJ homolog subfamily C member 17 n=1 Tax=Capra hircus TaxID=9925 RepID=A0A8C2SD78_CAPHI